MEGEGELPEALLSTKWWILTQHYGLRGRSEHHDMKVDDFQLCKDDNGVEFVQFTEGQTKNRQVPPYSATDLCRWW